MTLGSLREPDGIAPDVVLAARNIEKSFGAVRALRSVNFDVHRGQVTTLFGENGAGKSTLMKILAGVLTPTAGELVLDGRPVEIRVHHRGPRASASSNSIPPGT